MNENEDPPRRRRAHRRWYDERIWREFFCACIPLTPYDMNEAAKLADAAYTAYRERFPKEAAALEPETESETGSLQSEKEPVQ